MGSRLCELASAARGSQAAGITQPRVHLLADPCMCLIAFCDCFAYPQFHCDCHSAYRILRLVRFCDYLALDPMVVEKSDKARLLCANDLAFSEETEYR